MNTPFNLRKILIIAGFALLVIGLGLGLYFAFFKPAAPVAETPEAETPTAAGGLPAAGIAGPRPAGAPETPAETPGGLPVAKTIATADFALTGTSGITMDASGQSIQYYDSASGLFYKASANGTLSPLSNKKFFQVQSAVWSGDSSKAVLEYPDGSNIVYDFTTDKQVTLPRHWKDFAFSPDNDKIISKSVGDDINNRWLVISDTNGANAKIISPLGDNADKVQVAWSPNNQVVGFSATGDPTGEFGTQEIYLIGQNNENFKSLKVRGTNFKTEWAKEGDRIIYSVADPQNGYRPTLWVADVSGDNVGTNSVKVNLNTFVDRCAVISGYKAYCAVPKNLDEGAGFDARLAAETDDEFYFVDLKTGAASFVGAPETSYSVNHISVSADENYLYFTDKANGGLHQMRIK